MGKKTSLYDAHLEAGATIVDFFGWDMPLHYGSQLDEHHFVRKDAGMFDVCKVSKAAADQFTGKIKPEAVGKKMKVINDKPE